MDTYSKTWIKSIPVELIVLEMTYFDHQIICGNIGGKVTIYNTDLIDQSEYGTATQGGPISIAANELFIAYGDTEGVVRFYTRKGLAREMVSQDLDRNRLSG